MMHKADETAYFEALRLTLESLDPDELMWIKYALYRKTQTLYADFENRTVQALRKKGLIEEGSGHLLNLPFRIPDAAWRYLTDHEAEFLPESEVAEKRFAAKAEHFRKSLGPRRATLKPE